jgi:methionyl-tRNA formyltransferase
MEKKIAEIGAKIFSDILSDFSEGKIAGKKQNHEEVTFCKKFEKKDMELKFPFSEKNSRENFLKYCAFSKPFYFDKDEKRNIVTKAK